MLQGTYGKKGSKGPQTDEERDLQALSEAQISLEKLGTQLKLFQAALLLASEGTDRATVSEIARKAAEEFGMEILPSVAGQALSPHGLKTTTSHGRTRLVLEAGRLREIQDQLTSRLDHIGPQVEAAASRFEGLGETLGALEQRVQQVSALVMREKEIQVFLKRHAPRGI